MVSIRKPLFNNIEGLDGNEGCLHSIDDLEVILSAANSVIYVTKKVYLKDWMEAI